MQTSITAWVRPTNCSNVPSKPFKGPLLDRVFGRWFRLGIAIRLRFHSVPCERTTPTRVGSLFEIVIIHWIVGRGGASDLDMSGNRNVPCLHYIPLDFPLSFNRWNTG
jgi:hypothetical protein